MPSPHDFLLFRLWGPMSSWGSIAVGEQRQTWSRPSRSAVLGLVAAALGIERADAAAHQPLETGLGFAVRVDGVGFPLRDYHTAQSPSAEGRRRWRSRHDEIHGAKTLNTILSERSYHAGMDAVVILWRRGVATGTTPTLDVIAGKLRQPTFTLYLGRKASPLGVPIDPVIVRSDTIEDALAMFEQHEQQRRAAAASSKTWVLRQVLDRMPQASRGRSLWLDPVDMDVVRSNARGRQTQRRDGIRDRRTWTFDDRQEIEIPLEVTS